MRFDVDPAYREEVLAGLRRRAKAQPVLARDTGVVTDPKRIAEWATARDMRFKDGVVRRVPTLPIQSFSAILGRAHKTAHTWVAMGHLPMPLSVLATGRPDPRYTLEEAHVYARILDANVRNRGLTKADHWFAPENSISGRLYAARNIIAKRIFPGEHA